MCLTPLGPQVGTPRRVVLSHIAKGVRDNGQPCHPPICFRTASNQMAAKSQAVRKGRPTAGPVSRSANAAFAPACSDQVQHVTPAGAKPIQGCTVRPGIEPPATPCVKRTQAQTSSFRVSTYLPSALGLKARGQDALALLREQQAHASRSPQIQGHVRPLAPLLGKPELEEREKSIRL